jgi:transposase
MFLPELCEAFCAAFGIKISPSTVGRILKEKGLTLKVGTTRFDRAAAGREFLTTANFLND